MKKTTILLYFLICFSAAVQAQPIDTPYAYPITPGTEQWRKFGTQAEMISACQIPEDILDRLSTAALVETCLNYPLFSQITAYNSVQDGFNRFATQFNGLIELLSRQDAPDLLLTKYKEMDPSGYMQSWSSVRKGKFIYHYLFIEIILAQDDIISKFDTDAKRELAREAIRTFDAKVKEKELFGLVGLSHTSFVMSKTLSSEGDDAYKRLRNENERIGKFQDTAQIMGIDALMSIRNLTEAFLH